MKKKQELYDVEIAIPEIAKQRLCLHCRDGFTSFWSGDRICGRCKRSSSWRAGVPHKRTDVR